MIKIEWQEFVVDIEPVDETAEKIALDISFANTGTGEIWRGTIHYQEDSGWRKVDDMDMRQLWVCKCGDCESEGCESVYVSPEYIALNGHPYCKCGYEMTYQRTEVKQILA